MTLMTRPRRGVRTAAGAAAVLAALLGYAAPATADVRINEILADPAGDWSGDGTVDYKSDEWVEVINLGAESVDLGEYWLRDAAATEPRMRLAGTLAPYATAVFTGADAVAWQAAAGLATAGLSLNNDGDTVTLLRAVAGADGPLLEPADQAAYLDHEAEDDRSCGLSEDGARWILFDGLLPYAGDLEPSGTGCLPTFAAPNVCPDLVPAQGRSFGGLKAAYF